MKFKKSKKVNKTVYLAGFQISFKSRIAKPSKFIIIELSWDPILGAFQNGRQNTKTLVDKSLSGVFDIFRLVFIGGNQRK